MAQYEPKKASKRSKSSSNKRNRSCRPAQKCIKNTQSPLRIQICIILLNFGHFWALFGATLGSFSDYFRLFLRCFWCPFRGFNTSKIMQAEAKKMQISAKVPKKNMQIGAKYSLFSTYKSLVLLKNGQNRRVNLS